MNPTRSAISPSMIELIMLRVNTNDYVLLYIYLCLHLSVIDIFKALDPDYILYIGLDFRA